MKLCIVIPVYNHEHAIERMLQMLSRFALPCILVDDGSSDTCAAVLRTLAERHMLWVSLLRLETNQGKGAAVMAGFRAAARMGFDHVLQIDADGQHSPADIPKFMDAAQASPQAVICGQPIYDQSVPKARLYGRYISHLWVWINTLSLDIRDSMCGFRIYPLAPVMALIEQVPIGKRMDFDTEIVIRLHWRGVPVVNIPTPVRYPLDGVSHFRMFRDNLFIVWMHTRLFVGMLLRAPMLLRRKI